MNETQSKTNTFKKKQKIIQNRVDKNKKTNKPKRKVIQKKKKVKQKQII